jgi:hypothetical protein
VGWKSPTEAILWIILEDDESLRGDCADEVALHIGSMSGSIRRKGVNALNP